MRFFFALWPDEDINRQLTELAGRLNLERRGRRVDPKNYHMTLVFVGEVPATKLAVLQQIGRSLRVPRFTLNCDAIEFWQDSKVVVTVVRTPPPGLLDLCSRLSAALELPPPKSPRPHVTLARKVVQAPVLQAMLPMEWWTTTFSLIRSDTGGAESAYTVVDTWSLLDEMQNH